MCSSKRYSKTWSYKLRHSITRSGTSLQPSWAFQYLTYVISISGSKNPPFHCAMQWEIILLNGIALIWLEGLPPIWTSSRPWGAWQPHFDFSIVRSKPKTRWDMKKLQTWPTIQKRWVIPGLLSPVHVRIHVVTSNDERVCSNSLDPDRAGWAAQVINGAVIARFSEDVEP